MADRKQPQFMTDDELLKCLEDSDFEIEDLIDDPDVVFDDAEPDEQPVQDDDDIELQDGQAHNPYFVEELPDEDTIAEPDDNPLQPGNTIDDSQEQHNISEGDVPNLDLSDIPQGRGRGMPNRGRQYRRGRGRQARRGRNGTNSRRVENWSGKVLNNNFPLFQPNPDCRVIREGWKPLQYFSEYFDDAFFSLMVEQTNVYYHLQKGRELKATLQEMKAFVGISVLMSVLGYPRIRLYWDKYYGIDLVSKSMPRDRYFQFRSAVHVVNNNEITRDTKERDKLWKVRPIIEKFREAILKIPRESDLSIDEQMVPFTGHVSFRQFVPRKPNPTGLKNYILATKQGLILDFEVYQGAETTRLPPEVNGPLKLGAGGKAVLRLAETCPPGTNLYFDRFFTGMALLEALKTKGISGTGTTMKQRFPNTNLKHDSVLTAEGRGACDVKIRDDESVLLLKWVDNKTITLASTVHGKNPVGKARRYSRAEKCYVDVDMPNLIREYNLNMGGVDLHNRMIAHYRSYHRTNKWPVRFLEHFFDMAIVNSWLSYKDDCLKTGVQKREIMDLHFFKMRIAQQLIHTKAIPSRRSETESDTEEPPRKKQAGRPGKVPLPPPEKRTNAALHLPQATDQKDAQRCRNPGCSGKTRVKCVECQIFLCVVKERNCFLNYHKL